MKKVQKIIIFLLLIMILTGCTGNNVFLNITADNSQPYWNILTHNFAKGESGYYFMDTENKCLMHFNPADKELTPVCNKENCSHNDENCYAYLDPMVYIPVSVWYYKGYIYLLKYDDGNVVLVQVNKNGDEKKDLCIIGSADVISNKYNIVFHDDCIYIYNTSINDMMDKKSTNYIKKISLNGEINEIIYENKNDNIMINTAKSYGSNLFFTVENIEIDSGNKNNLSIRFDSLGLFSYDYNTGKIEKVLDKKVYDYTIDVNNKILYYYVINEGLYKMNWETKEETKIYESDNDSVLCNISCDSKNIYMSNERWYRFNNRNENNSIKSYMWAISPDGEIKNKIESFGVYFGDENYIFGEIADSNGIKSAYIDKSDIEKVNQWTLIKP